MENIDGIMVITHSICQEWYENQSWLLYSSKISVLLILSTFWDENWLTIQSVPSQRHDTMVQRQIWFYIDVEEHNEPLAGLIVSNRVSPLNTHWVKSIFFLQCSICVRERERHTVHNRASIVMGIIQKVLMVAIVRRKLFFWWDTDIVRKDIQ